MMKRIFIRNAAVTGLSAALFLTGCAGTATSHKTQEISGSAASSAQSQESAAPAESSVSPASAPETAAESLSQETAASQTSLSDIVTGDPETDEANYCRIKAEKDAVETDIENLEASFRIGTISQEDFTAQKRELKAQEDLLDAQEDLLEASLDLAYTKNSPSLPEGSAKELFARKQTLDSEGDKLEKEADLLESEYRSGNISREDFISRQSELIKKQEAADREEELLEIALESMGFDD